MFRVSTCRLSLAVFLCACAPVQASADAPLQTPTNYSVLPVDAGFELRAQAQVLRYDLEGRITGRSEEQRGPTQAFHAWYQRQPSVRWTYALPAQAGLDAVALTPPYLDRPWRMCERLSLEDGRRLMRLSAFPSLTLNEISTPLVQWSPLPGSLSFVDDDLDDAYFRGAVARDAQGLVHVLVNSGIGVPGYRMATFAQDCELIGEVLDPHSFDAHPAHPGAYAVQRRGGFGPTPYLLRRIGAETVWEVDLGWMLGAERNEGLNFVWALNDGGALVALRTGPTDARQLQLARFSQDGRLLARGAIDGSRVPALRQFSDGLILAVVTGDQSTGADLLVELGLDLAERRRELLGSVRVHGVLNSADEGLRSDVWLLTDRSSVLPAAEVSTVDGLRYGAARVQPGLQLEWVLPMGAERPRMQLAGGDLLLSGRSGGSIELVRRSADGRMRVQESPAIRPLGSAASEVARAALMDGSVASVRTQGAMTRLALHMRERLIWSQPLASASEPHVAFVGLVVEPSSARVCAVFWRQAASVDLRCHARADGTALPVLSWPESASVIGSVQALFDGAGNISLFAEVEESAPDRARRLREWRVARDPAGQQLPSVVSRDAVPPMSCPRGSALPTLRLRGGAGGALVERSGGQQSLLRIAVDGREVWRKLLPGGWQCPEVLGLSPTGGVVVAERDARGAPGDFLAFDASGDIAWNRSPADVLGSSFAASGAEYRSMRWFHPEGADAWLVDVDVFNAGMTPSLRSSLRVLDAGSGASRAWLQTAPASHELANRAFSTLATDNQVTVFELGQEQALSRRLDLGSGRLGPVSELRAHFFDELQLATVAGDRLQLRAYSADSAEVIGFRALDALPLAPERAVGEVHSGQWYDPQATGQGLYLDVESATNRWFGAWFTYARAADESAAARGALRSRLNWYSMLGQGSSASGMPITGTLYSTGGGRFDGGGPQTVERGRAFLRAIDCNTLEFAYAIPDSDEAAAPVLTGARRLQRLGPAPAACGGASLAEQSGLRAASTGSWVLEGRPNQGLLMQVDPGIAGGAGALWGAWFGFDAGEPDDALAQHWLTVIGRSAAAQPDVVELEWMRTLGGSFDAQPTRNTRVIGTGRLRFTACDRAVLEYSFAAPGLQGDAFAGLQGQVNLRRFEPCR